jgi:DNA-directed RNA polymerase II subunit RPB2
METSKNIENVSEIKEEDNSKQKEKQILDDTLCWNIINKYFSSDKYALVKHHIDSYDDFFDKRIKQIIIENNPIQLRKNFNTKTKTYDIEINLYIGGYDGSKIYLGSKPVIFDGDKSHYMTPNEARLRDMTYSTSIFYDVDVEFIHRNIEGLDDNGKELPSENKTEITIEGRTFGRIPIMTHSKKCILRDLPNNVKFQMGECYNDNGGYFIIDGKEKAIIPQEKFADNMMYIRENKDETSHYTHSCVMRTVSENASKPERTLKIHIVRENDKYTMNNIVVEVPNVRKPVPLFILMRALGVLTDKRIVEMILLDTEKYKSLLPLLRPSVHDAGTIFTQQEAIYFISILTKRKSISNTHDILMNYFLPQIGEDNYITKAYYLGYMVLELLLVCKKIKMPTDRDSFNFKRVELTGTLLTQLFKEYYSLQKRNIYLNIDKRLYFQHNKEVTEEMEKEDELQTITKEKDVYDLDEDKFLLMFTNHGNDFFKNKIIEKGFKKAFKGNWGSEAHTKRVGLVQDLNRLSLNSALSQLRKLNLPLDSSAKVVGPRLLHGSQYGMIDPIDTPDGGNIGLHKHMSIATHISNHISSESMISWLKTNLHEYMINYEYEKFSYVSSLVKIFVNEMWIASTNNPFEFVSKFKLLRRVGCLNWSVSIAFHISKNSIYIYCDEGRLLRPLIFIEDNKLSLQLNKTLTTKIKDNNFEWNNLINGTSDKKLNKNLTPLSEFEPLIEDKEENSDVINQNTQSKNKHDLHELEKKFKSNMAIIDFIDTNETEVSIIASSEENFSEETRGFTKYSHLEIHPSLLFGVMGNQVIYPENNPPTRNLFSCGQNKQAVSLYHSNYQNRFDKTGIVLNYGQVPLVKSRYLEHIQRESQPYGENAIVAIMCYGGYNVEDAILVNKGAIDRGLFRTTYFSCVQTREESKTIPESDVDSKIQQVKKGDNVINKNPKSEYQYLDENGIVKEGTKLNDKIVLIGKVIKNEETKELIDASITPKKGQLGNVDRVFLSEDDEGFRIAKVKICEERIPAIGDKMASRAGQKGTIGLIIPHEDMPFTKDGIVPDLIINPHAIPSRMTIGQIVECILGKICTNIGGFGDCTAYVNKGDKSEIFGKILQDYGYSSTGNEILYNGYTGEQLKSDIFIGPTYYMRLKHMVKDKINYRARGPRQQLTRQTLQGRANDGGLRIGEMERDGVIAHGASYFLNESFMVRGDEYYMVICNQSGTIAVYNTEKKAMYSLHSDGPLQFTEITNNDDKMHVKTISHYGRSFSVVRIPYTMKLLIQELQVMNIQMRIITEDNINNFDSITFSNNISNLVKEDDFYKAINNTLFDMRNIAYLDKQTPSNIPSINKEPKSPDNSPFQPPSPDNTPPESVNSVVWQVPDTPESVKMRLKEKEERGEVSNELSVNTVPWAPNSLDLNNNNNNNNKPTVVFQNDDGSISKAEVQKESDVINEINNGSQLLQKPEEEKKKDNDKEKNNDDEGNNSAETKKIITTND